MMNLAQYNFSFEELDCIFSYAEEFMGFRQGSVPEPFYSLIAEVYEELPRLINIRAGFLTIENPEFANHSKTITIEGITFNPGRIVFSQLKGAIEVGLFVATAGSGISRVIDESTASGDSLRAYVYDAFGSVVASKAVDRLIERIELSVKENGWGISDPFSPGYCDWSVAEQHKLFSFFPEGFCGVTLTESSLMMPIKSVSGIVGIGDTMQRKGYQCAMCNDTECFVGRIHRKKNPEEPNF